MELTILAQGYQYGPKINEISVDTHSTGQKYIYTGSHDSCVYVYDLVSGAIVAKLQYHRSTVRDCSWHPSYPMLISSSWDGDVVKWEFPGNGEEEKDHSKTQQVQRRNFQ